MAADYVAGTRCHLIVTEVTLVKLLAREYKETLKQGMAIKLEEKISLRNVKFFW